MKRTTKLLITVVAIVLIACAGIILIGNLSKGFQNLNPTEWELHEVNKDNLYQAMAFADENGVLADGEHGVTATIDDDHVIKVTGTAVNDFDMLIGTYTLKANTSYVLDSSFNGNKGNVYMVLMDGDTVFKSVYNSTVVISASDMPADRTVTLKLLFVEGASIDNAKIRPVLCVGTTADDLVDFYK